MVHILSGAHLVQRDLPSGEVTFAFTDVVGSTDLLAKHGDNFVEALGRVQGAVKEAVESAGGVLVSTEGDGAFAAFSSASAAVAALCSAVSMTRQAGPLLLRLRAGAHTGHAVPIDDDYIAMPVHVAARVAAAAGAEQVLVSQSVVEAHGPAGRDWVDLGERVLKGIPEGVRLWRVAGPEIPCAAPPTKRTNVAPPRTTFVGREAEMDALSSLVDQHPLVTVVGPGGTGKTRLVSELVQRKAPGLEGGAWLIELASVTKPEDVARAVAKVVQPAAGTSSIESLADELGLQGRMLLVLDNCEHVIEAVVEIVEALLDRVPYVRCLCTSREPLEVSGERIFALRPLETTENGSGAAERLFLDRAAEAGVSEERLDGELVTAICRILDGVPLALELAAARAPHVPLPRLMSLLESEAGAGLTRRGGDPRQRSLTALVDWSLRQLDEHQHSALLCLALMPGRLPMVEAIDLLERVPRVGAAAAPAVSGLIRRSLVDLEGDDVRLLFVVASIAKELLREDGELARAAERALLDWSGSVMARRPLPETMEWIDLVRRLERPLRLAAIISGADNAPVTAAILDGLRTHYNLTGLPEELSPLLLKMAAPEADQDRGRFEARLTALDILIGLGWNAGTGNSSLHLLVPDPMELVERADREGDPRLRVRARRVAVAFPLFSGQVDEVEGLMTDAARIAVEHDVDSDREQGLSHLNIGATKHFAGDLEEALEHYRRAYALLLESGDEINIGIALHNMGEALVDLGRPKDALESLVEAQLHAPGNTMPVLTARSLYVEALFQMGETNEAERERAELLPLLESVEARFPPGSFTYSTRLKAAGTYRL